MPSIAVLPDELIDQIAAGEVVERPASVVKELGENALDAGARSIRVVLEGGGSRLIEVTDDGSGMSREDAVLSVRRHATSKLRAAEDLLAIRTLGFRGEALAAIASVSRLVLRTALHRAPEGTEVVVDEGEPQVSVAAARPGTQVRVEDLFGAVPARRKFLRRTETELKHVEDAVLRLALAHPEVAFRLEHDGRPVQVLPPSPGDLRERIATTLGPEVAPFLLPLEERRLGLRVHGVIASPEFSLSSARSLYVFVNGRHVRDRTLHFAVHRGLAPSLPAGRQPVGVIFVEIEPSRVDVNVHPQKLEVRFADAAEVTEAVQAAISRAVLRDSLASSPGRPPPSPDYAAAVERFLSRASAAPLPLPEVQDRPPAHGEALPDRDATPAPGYFAALRPLGTLRGRALVCEGPGGSLVVLDLHAARERVLAQRLEREAAAPVAAPLLGAALALTPAMESRLSARRQELADAGIVVEPFGPDAYRPVAALEGGQRAPEVRAALACAAATEGREPSADEIRQLLAALDATDPVSRVRHRRVVVEERAVLSLLP
ncbi:MAG TPA: DNA mismatch repair endonuclease MutL [Myxococcaceae bacterium]|nr:DNA mismatch repair endonuclease MutL [Myxococcaceae bacterium]